MKMSFETVDDLTTMSALGLKDHLRQNSTKFGQHPRLTVCRRNFGSRNGIQCKIPEDEVLDYRRSAPTPSTTDRSGPPGFQEKSEKKRKTSDLSGFWKKFKSIKVKSKNGNNQVLHMDSTALFSFV